MTLTLELPAEVERALEEKARDSGQSVTEYALQLLAREAGNGVATQPKRQARSSGIAAHLGISSEDIHREHREEVERDERHYYSGSEKGCRRSDTSGRRG